MDPATIIHRYFVRRRDEPSRRENINSPYLNFHNQLVNIFLHALRLDRNLGRFLDDVGPTEPRDFRLRVRFAFALHRDQGAGLVRNDPRFLDERRRESGPFFCILERSMVKQGNANRAVLWTAGTTRPDSDSRRSTFSRVATRRSLLGLSWLRVS